MSEEQDEFSCVGKISGVFGIKGWVKVKSFTEPEENIFEYSPWLLKVKRSDIAEKAKGESRASAWLELEVDEAQPHKDGWIAHIKGIDDRTEADAFKLKDIHVSREHFAGLEGNDYYWHELIGLRVVAQQASTTPRDLGVVDQLMETGANDVLVVRPDEQSFDGRERLIPYVWDMYVTSVDLDKKQVVVDWHIED